MSHTAARNLNWSYLLIRTVEVSHRCKPGIVDRIGEDRPNILLVGHSVRCSS